MSVQSATAKGRFDLIVWLVVLAAITAYASASGSWFLTAFPIGFLFGFFLQKGDLCGSSAMSEVLLFRDARKLAGLWVAGTVLAGGCISGCLYKAGAGNLNSMAAVAAMPLGIAIVEHGPLNSAHLRLKSQVIAAADGGPVTLSSLTGLPFWVLAVFFALVTLGVAMRLRRGAARPAEAEPLSRRLLHRPWPPWQAGVAIGLLAVAGFLSAVASGRSYPLGVTHGVLHAYELATDDVALVSGRAASAAAAAQAPAPRRTVSGWLILVVVAMVPGSWTAARLSGQAKLLPKPPEQVVIAFGGGILVGVGAAFATGCVVGNILSGWALMSVGMLLFGVVTLLANWATAWLYLRGTS